MLIIKLTTLLQAMNFQLQTGHSLRIMEVIKKGRAAKVFINRWIDKEDVVYEHSGILLTMKRENSAICSNMDGPRIYHTKCSKSERETQISNNTTYVSESPQSCPALCDPMDYRL